MVEKFVRVQVSGFSFFRMFIQNDFAKSFFESGDPCLNLLFRPFLVE